MNLMRIKYFVEVAKCGSFSRAAQLLYVSQPNLSRQIALMEQEVGFQLFRRNGKSINLTRAGEYLYGQFRDLPEMTERAIANAEAISRRDAYSISIGVLDGQEVNALLEEYLRPLREKNPDVVIELERNSFRNLRQGLDRGTYDMLITMEFETEGREDWESCELVRQPGAMMIRSDHPLARRETVSLADFKDEPFVAISREESPGGYQLLFRECAKHGFVPNVVRETSSPESLFLCVELGIGAAMLDRNTRLESSTAVQVVDLPDSYAAAMVAVWRKDNCNPMVARLVQALTKG